MLKADDLGAQVFLGRGKHQGGDATAALDHGSARCAAFANYGSNELRRCGVSRVAPATGETAGHEINIASFEKSGTQPASSQHQVVRLKSGLKCYPPPVRPAFRADKVSREDTAQ